MPYDPQALMQQWQAWKAGQTTVGKIDPETGGVGRLIETVRQQAPPPVPVPQAEPPAPWWAAIPGAVSSGVAAQFAPPTWQAPGQPPPAEQPSFIPPPEGKPEWAQEPVPETWGEYPSWWLGRQAGHIGEWWEQAQEEIWGEPEERLEPGEAIAQQWAEAWEPAIAADAAYSALPEKTPEAFLKALPGAALGVIRGVAGGIIGAPVAGLKAAPGVAGKLFTALDQAARGVTGALAGGFEIFDTGLVEQGILGAGAELIWPTLQGHEADFTPQEFEAGRNRYTRWYTSVSTYSKELWDARMKGVDWDTALDRASTKAGAATEELRNLTLEAIRNGATREDIEADATLTKPLAELAGRVILDPLNLLGKPGHAARMRGQASTATKALNFEDAGHYDEILDLMKVEGANNAAGGFKGPIYKILHPNRADNATLAGRWAEDSTLVLSQMLGQATDPGEISDIIRSMINLGDEGTDAARAAQVHLKKFGRISESSAGKKGTLLLREMATDPDTGKLSLKVVGDWFKDAKSDGEILKRIFKNYDGAVARVYPTGKLNRFRRAQNQYRKFLSQYMYMGWNPGYAFRNGASNASLTAISGWGPFQSADRINDYVKRWGGDVFGLRKGYGGPGGEYLTEQLHSALEAIDSSFEAVRFKDLPAAVIEDLAKKGIKGAPAMALSEVVETASGQRVMHQSLDYFWGQHWRPKVPDELRALFPDQRTVQAYEGILADCVNPGELENALGPALMGRVLPEGIDIRGLPTDLRNDIRLAMLEAENGEDFARRMQDLGGRADEFLTKTLDETATEISKGDELVYPITQADRQAIEAVEDSELGTKLHGLQDEFEQQLGRDRARDLANEKTLGEYHHQAPPEAKNQIMDLVLAHREDGGQVTLRVDDARRQAWQASDATKIRAERDVIWDEYFTFRNDEWRKYWDEFDQQATELLSRRPPTAAPVAPPPVRPAPPAPAAEAPPVAPPMQAAEEVTEDVAKAVEVPPPTAPTGTKQSAAFGITDPNMRYEFEYRVVDLDELVTSHTDTLAPTKGYPQELQGRIRDRAASQTQIDRIAKGLNPDALLTDVKQLDRGPMITGPDLIVESGNGRVMALRRARGTVPDKYQEYTNALRGRLSEYGLSEADIAGIKNPVLVRVRQTDVDRVAFAAEANYSPTLAMSLVEQAITDAEKIVPELLAQLDVGATVSIDQALRSSRNRGFVESFLNKVPANERATLVDAAGVVNRNGIKRIKDAMFINTYSGAGQRLAEAFESIEPVIKNIENAMFASLPDMARAEGLIRSGRRAADLSLADDMAVAVSKFHDLKSSGASIQDYLAQLPLFEPELSPFQHRMLEFLNEQGRSPKAVREMLRNYARAVVEQPDMRQLGMFGEVSRASREDLLNAAIAQVKPELGPLFAGIEEAPRAAARAAPREELARAPQPPGIEARAPVEPVGPEVREAVEGVAAPPEITPSDLDAPDFIARRDEIAEEVLADIVPSRQAIAHISNKQAKQILEDLANAAPGMNWAPLEGLTPENYERVMDWAKNDLMPQLHESKLIANKVALNERDFILFNYSDRRHFDNALAYVFPYHYWYTRAATNVPRMLGYKPGMLSAYLDYKDAVHQINEEAQGLDWWEEQVKVPGTQFYLNLEATLNPLYSMMNDFKNPGRTETWQGEMLENLGNLGPSVDTAFWALYAAWRAAEGKPEEALASFGYLGQPTKAFRYATGLLGAKGGKGITLEPWLWDDPFSFTGMDYYERNRMGYQFKQMEDEGAVTPEVIWDEGYKQAGPAWDEAMKRQTQERAVPMLTSWLMGVGFKPRLPYEIQVQKALNAQYQFYEHADRTYDMSTEEGQAAYRGAQQQLYEYYPFLSYTMLVRRGEQERDKAYAWEVLSRLPPGSKRYTILEAANTSEEALSKFYESSGDFTGWSEVDRSHFMASVQSLGNVLAIPDTARQKEWDSAQTLKRAMDADLKVRFGDDIFDIQAVYYDVRDISGADAAKAILDANPKLGDMWTAKSATIIASPALMSYFGSLDTLDRVGTNLLWEEMEKRWPNYKETNSIYYKQFDKDEWKEQRAYRRDYLKANEWLKAAWDFKDKMQTSLDVEIEQLAAEMIPPLGPITRDDTDLNSVLAERITRVLGASFEAGEMVETRAPIAEGAAPTVMAEAPVEEPLGVAPPLDVTVDTEAETVVQYEGEEAPRGTTWRRGAAAPSRAPTTTKFSWNYVKSQLGQSAFALIQHWQSGKPLGELKGRLEEMYRSNPLGLGDFDSWLKFVKSLWRASVVSSRGGSIKGLAKKPRSFWSGQGQPGAGRKFLPWG